MLVIFSGLPGTGKTSAAEELSRQLRAERLTTDELRRRIDKHPDYSQKHKRSIYAALMKEAEKCIQKGKKVILDGTFFKQEMRQRARELAQKHDESFYVVFVTCPQGIVKKRLEKREKAGADASEADFRVYKIIQKQFEEIEDPDYIIDTSDEAEWKEKIPDLANRIRIKSRHTGMIDPLMKEGRRLFQTHMSWIILDGTYAWKIKKPVKYQFVDYSTLAQRKKFCFREKRLNSLISPSMYMGVESIVKTNGKVEFGQGGSILDYCVKMKELSQEDRMDHRLEKNQVSRDHIQKIACILFDFHKRSHKAEKKYGTVEVIQDNFKPAFEMRDLIQKKLGQGKRVDSIRRNVENFLKTHHPLFQKRNREGKVRHGHGDVRSKNLFLTEEDIYLFDAVEFSEKIASCDVAADLAYLAMDLDFFGRGDFAKILVDRYARISDDPDLYKLIDFYLCYRAMVQVLVQAYLLQDEELSEEQKDEAGKLCKRYLELAEKFSNPE